jgi:shikimate dehydrogenase
MFTSQGTLSPYHLNRMQTPVIHLGLTGYPLGHSLSPKIHSAAMAEFGINGDYSPYPIQPDDWQGMKDLLTRVREHNIHGLNVTIPHKESIIPFLDELTQTAEAIGAVNTIYLKKDKLIGENTDAAGFLTDLKQKTTLPNLDQIPSALILGAGGAARAIVFALKNEGWHITLAARRIEQAEEVAMKFGNVEIVEFSERTLNKLTPHLIVNTTSLGMAPDLDQSPWPDLPLPPNAVIYDLVYNPRETKLVSDARSRGLSAISGMGMLIEQAALSFEIWTGYRPSRPVLMNAVNQ